MKMIYKKTGATIEVAPVICDGKHALVDIDGNYYERDQLVFIPPGKTTVATSANTNAVNLKMNITATGSLVVNPRST